MVIQYSELQPTSGWDLLASFRHPCKFQCVSRLGSVTVRQSSSGHQPNFAALNIGRHLYSAGRPSRWAFPHILVCVWNISGNAERICAMNSHFFVMGQIGLNSGKNPCALFNLNRRILNIFPSGGDFAPKLSYVYRLSKAFRVLEERPSVCPSRINFFILTVSTVEAPKVTQISLWDR